MYSNSAEFLEPIFHALRTVSVMYSTNVWLASLRLAMVVVAMHNQGVAYTKHFSADFRITRGF